MVPEQAIIKSLSNEFNLSEKHQKNFSMHLANAINDLIQNDFSRLVQILYRMDISESKLKEMLAANTGDDAGSVMARLIIERETQKVQSRKQFKRNDNISDSEKW